MDAVTLVSFYPDANATCHILMHRYFDGAAQLPVDSALRLRPGAQVHGIATQVTRRSCTGVLTLLLRGPCTAEQANRRYRTAAISKLSRFNVKVRLGFHTAIQVSWRWSVCDLILSMRSDGSEQMYKLWCPVYLTLLHTSSYSLALVSIRRCTTAKRLHRC
jgi:hypothetical protein